MCRSNSLPTTGSRSLRARDGIAHYVRRRGPLQGASPVLAPVVAVVAAEMVVEVPRVGTAATTFTDGPVS